MPSSYPHNISPLLQRIITFNPHDVLDVGTGYGKWGFLLREYLDDFRYERVIDGVEIFGDYIVRSRARGFYTTLERVNFLNMLREFSYDLVLMIDVLEHFTTSDGRLAIEKALSFSPTVLISTPLNYPQGAENGNEHERHRSEWRPDDLREFGRWADFSDDRSTMGFLTR